ncbi:DUF4391 domain-containing protein [Dialister micraerophilus]|uniref:DUF4391 domain-containing protein n=1 Tax=Dialister micraerophilus TaxID=309120 RepID=UPI0023F28C3C|nr:DUF4391 domain-containing protein [Dialister micraerophilus]
MFNFPKSTEIKINIYKKDIYKKFPKELKGNKKEQFDREISKITLTNEISEKSVNISKTEKISAIFVLRIKLKTKDYSEKNIEFIAKVFKQKMLMILECENQYKLAIYELKLYTSEWKEKINLEIKGLDLEKVWENLVKEIGKIKITDGQTLEEQIEINTEKEKLENEIEKLKTKMYKEKQSKKKYEIHQEIKKLKSKL